MKITNNTSCKIICLIHEHKKKVYLEPFSERKISFYPGTYLIASVDVENSIEYHTAWDPIFVDHDGEIIIGSFLKKSAGNITQVSSSDISTVVFKNHGKSLLSLFSNGKSICSLLPGEEHISRGIDALGFFIGQEIQVMDGNVLSGKFHLTDKWTTRVDLGLILLRKTC